MIQAKSYGRNHPIWLLSNFLLVRTRAKFWISVAGCLLDNSAPRGPPDVPPRNPTMSRVNGRLPGSHAASDHERDPDLQPSCLVRTSSGGFYSIPSEYPRGVARSAIAPWWKRRCSTKSLLENCLILLQCVKDRRWIIGQIGRHWRIKRRIMFLLREF